MKQTSVHSDHDTIPPLDANDHIVQELQVTTNISGFHLEILLRGAIGKKQTFGGGGGR